MKNESICKFGFDVKALFAGGILALAGSAYLVLVVPVCVNAQAPIGEGPLSRSGESEPRFDVASIKPSDPGHGVFGKPFSYTSGRFIGRNVTLSGLAYEAYGLTEAYQMETTASWMVTRRYDLEANVPEGTAIQQVHVMLQHLLAERFGLVVRHERRPYTGYRLMVAKGGAKLKKSVEAPTIDVSGDSIVTKDGVRRFADNARSGVLLTVEEVQLHGRKETISGLAHYLTQVLRAPVLDDTGIEGEYDYDLSFAPPEHGSLPKGNVVVPPAGAGGSVPQISPDPLDIHPMVFSVLTKQLGLRLESDKSIPVEVLVLDKANPDPTEN